MRMMITAAASAQVTVPEPPTGPTALPDTATTLIGNAISVFILDNDTHPRDVETLGLSSVSINPLHGTAVIAAAGVITYTPAPGFFGEAVITYTISDESGDTASSTLTITVSADALPAAVPDTATTYEDRAVTVDVLANDSHPGGDDLTISAASVDPLEGTVSILGASLVFTPAADFLGDATISYTVEDQNGDQDTSTLVVTVIAALPVAVDDTASTDIDTPVSIAVLSNDIHLAGDALTIVAASVDPGEGTVAIVSDVVEFTPAPGFTGTATITYTIEDEGGDQDTGTVIVTVSAFVSTWAFDYAATLTPPAYQVFHNGSQSGPSKTGGNLWNNASDPLGGTNGVEFTSTVTSGVSGWKNFETFPIAGINFFRTAVKPVLAPTVKLYILMEAMGFLTTPWKVYFDITPDGTPAADRAHIISGPITRAEVYRDGEWFFLKHTVDLSGAAGTDRKGEFHWYMTDNMTGETLTTPSPTQIHMFRHTWAVD